MSLLVQKFGGTSVADSDKILAAARRAIQAHQRGDQVLVVVSARGHTTDELIALAKEITENPPAREMDMLLSTGEQVSVALMAMAIESLGVPAISFTGAQIGLVTDSFHTKARIRNISTERMAQALGEGKIVIVAGFQGVDEHYNITTLGRGGSDTTAVALAAVLGRRRLRDLHRRRRRLHDRPAGRSRGPQDRPDQLRRDARAGQPGGRRDALAVDRVRQEVRRADPRAQLVRRRAGDLDRRRARCPPAGRAGHRRGPGQGRGPDHDPRRARPARRGPRDLSHDRRGQYRGRHDRPERLDRRDHRGQLHRGQGRPARDPARRRGRRAARSAPPGVTHDADVAKVSVVGLGMRTHTGVATAMFEALADAGINIQMITTSEIKISVLVDRASAVAGLASRPPRVLARSSSTARRAPSASSADRSRDPRR